jgi:copper resistance protein C
MKPNHRLAALAAILCFIGQAAFAHAMLERASPAAGSVVSGSPPAIVLTFSEPVEPRFSSVAVTDGSGTRMDLGKPAIQGDKRTLFVELKPLRPGAYAVAWHVTSVDMHKMQGHFSFTVKP